jgi:spermidine synthase
MDVVDIDPTMLGIARKHFNLKDDERMQHYTTDARRFLNENTTKYDAIFSDLFEGSKGAKYSFSVQSNKRIFDSLSENGVFVANLIDKGVEGELIADYYNTIKEVFPHVLIFLPFKKLLGAKKSQNIFVVAIKNSKFKISDVQHTLFEYMYRGEIIKSEPIYDEDWSRLEPK